MSNQNYLSYQHYSPKALENLVQLAKTLSCAIVGITHLTKQHKGKSLLARMSGARAITQVARNILMTVRNENKESDDDPDYVLVRAKSSYSTTDVCHLPYKNQ